MLKGRLGLETARIPYVDRHGLVWLSRGHLSVEDGTLHFATPGVGELAPGDYTLPFQMVSCILLGPGGTVSHDALRLMARHGTGLVAVGEDGIRYYASMPFGRSDSALARRQVRAWADPDQRVQIARRMYAWRLGEVVPHSEISVLRGIEGMRMKETYRLVAEQVGIQWNRRKYDRGNPDAADLPNQAINHAATAVESAALVATAAVGALPQLGFIHEDAVHAFCLDIADLARDTITIPAAFLATREVQQGRQPGIERATRRMVGRMIREKKVIPGMIDRIKKLFPGTGGEPAGEEGADGSGGHP